jgi:hypothetical protein
VDQGRFWRSAVEAAPGSYKTNLSAANNTVFISQQDWDRSVGQIDICTASRNVAATYLRTRQYAEAAAVRRTAMQELGCTPELLN